MDNQLLKNILTTFDQYAFSEYIYEFWKLENAETDDYYRKTYPIPDIGNGILEQNYIKRIDANSSREYQGFNLIIPYYAPYDVFKQINFNEQVDPYLINILRKYKRRIDKRIEDWYWPQDGEYIMPTIALATNYCDINRDIYFEEIIPSLKKILDNEDMLGTVKVGSIDSFMELGQDGALKAFENFMNNHKPQISISLGDEIKVSEFESGKYLTEGVLQNTKTPCEPIFVKNANNKTEILAEFEYILNYRELESTLENFLAKYYKEIFGNHYDRIETQIWLNFPQFDINNKNRRTDIFLRNSIERDWELFELKRIQKSLTRTYRDVPVFKSEIQHAIQQIQNYKRILNQDEVKRKLAKDGIEYYEPELRLVIGKKPDINIEQWRWLKTSNEDKLKIITYDDLLEGMKKRFDLRDSLKL